VSQVHCCLLPRDGGGGGFMSKTGAVVTRPPRPPVSPVITLVSSIVVVKKPHTSPARQRVTLRSSSRFPRTGTLTIASPTVPIPIRFFTAAAGGTEITSGHVFTGAELSRGVTLFAEGSAPSVGANDVTLTLSLAAGSIPTGPDATATMTAVELTLDVAAPRTSPTIDPPPLSDTDKINPGRFLQVQDARRTHARAMLIVRLPNPLVSTTLVLTRVNSLVQIFANETPAAGDTPLPVPQTILSGIIPGSGARFFAEATGVSNAARDTGFRLGIQGLENEADRVAMTAVQLDVVATASAIAPAATLIRVGLWDHAFDATTGALVNSAPDASNFISLDSRNFFFRLKDPSVSGEARVSWRTVFGDGTADDVRPQPAITLTETGSGTHVFISKAVFHVTDDVDQQQATDSGLPPGNVDAGVRTFGQTNHRIRAITVDDTHRLDSGVVVEYGPVPGPAVASAAPSVFSRAPEERRRLRVHLVNVRATAGGTGVLLGARRELVKRTFRSVYARCGVFTEIDEIPLDPPASCIGWHTRYPADPIAIDPAVEGVSMSGPNVVPSQSMTDLINTVRARSDFNADDIYLIYVTFIYGAPVPAPPGPGLVSSAGGQSFADSFTAAGSVARGFAFVAVRSGITEFADPHEATHITTNLAGNIAGGHFDLGPSGATAPGPIDGRNLMHRFFLVNTLGVRNPKRLWNDVFTNRNQTPALVIPAQIDAVRASRFVHSF
jgi:hypothetical protein